ncbi:MAG: type II secretion system protein [Phycisphaerales bacterium]
MHPTRPTRAFSLIELLVAIGIIAILISITLPTLATTRIRANELKSVTNTRTITQHFTSYATDKGHFPFVKPGEAPPGVNHTPPPGVTLVRWWPENTIIGLDSHWSLALLWPGLIYERAPWKENYPTWVSPGRDPDLPTEPPEQPEFLVSYQYSNSFIAKPDVWRQDARLDADAISRVNPTTVAFPSSKAIIFDAELAYLRKTPNVSQGHYAHSTPIAFADGHAEAKDPTLATPGFPNPLNGGATTTLHNTPEGVLGRDF